MPVQLDKDKSFRFELVQSKTGDIKAHFNLIYPPEQYSIKETPRHNIMKLFSTDAQLYIDDFGDDNKVIKLRGTTGSPVARTGYADSYFKAYTGQEAMLEFRKQIINWRKQYKPFNEYVVKLYNLFDDEVYNIFITDFTMEKGAGKPLFYTYDMTMITIPQEPSVTQLTILQQITAKIQSAINAIQKTLDTAFALLNNNVVTNTIRDIRNFTENTLNQSQQLADTFSAALTTPVEIITDNRTAITDSVVNLGLISQTWEGKAPDGDYPLLFHPFVQSIKKMGQEWDKMSYFKKYFWVTKRKIGMKRGITFEEYLKSEPATENLLTTRLNTRAATTPEAALAARAQYGVDITGPDIAYVNDLSSTEIAEDAQILIPISDNVVVDFDNQVLTADKQNDRLGIDLGISDGVNGELLAGSGGDLGTVADMENMMQAIDNVLSAELKSFISLPEYGFDIKHTIGQSSVSAFIKTLKLKYIEAISRDPRVVDVENVIISVDRGAIKIDSRIRVISGSFDYTYKL